MKRLAPSPFLAASSRSIAALAAVALAAAGCDSTTVGGEGGGDASAGAGAPAEESERVAGITEAHNAARAAVDPPASPPLAPLVYDGELARVAQAYAERCVFEHSGNEYGENLYASAGQASTPQQVVDAWVSEVAQYDHASNACSGVCGHYTQVVWADTRRVGCGVATCSESSPFSGFTEWENWVCNYDPPGNWVGERPY